MIESELYHSNLEPWHCLKKNLSLASDSKALHSSTSGFVGVVSLHCQCAVAAETNTPIKSLFSKTAKPLQLFVWFKLVIQTGFLQDTITVNLCSSTIILQFIFHSRPTAGCPAY
jgi:hypothetical protein